MNKTTKSQLEAQLRRVVDVTGTNYSLSKWSPGDKDGTRYTLVIRDENGGERNIGRTFLGASAMYDALRLVEECFYVKERLDEDNYLKAKEVEA